jgi:ABC-type nitrate/sulfonate/bicarbonate transport system permease component
MRLFALRGKLKSREVLGLEVGGFVLLLSLWHILTMGDHPIMRPSLLPSPWSVLSVYPELIQDNDLMGNTMKSLSLNLAGYIEAIAIALPLGFLVGLLPLFKGLFQRQIDAFRYVPLTAVTGLFIVWFGLKTWMKVHFLAFGILIYLLPVVVQRIIEVKDVYVKTVYTLGATKFQTIKSVYFPSVISRVSDDIRVLTAISWTYIIVAESLGNQGGIGALIWRSGNRLGRVDKVFAILLLIILIGIVQDKLLIALDKEIFPYKYEREEESEPTIFRLVLSFTAKVVFWLLFGLYLFLLINSFTGIFISQDILLEWFGPSVWSIHFLLILLFGYRIIKMLKK